MSSKILWSYVKTRDGICANSPNQKQAEPVQISSAPRTWLLRKP
ncbi:hypothetical protein NECAME_06910, partial [Necator americanus]